MASPKDIKDEPELETLLEVEPPTLQPSTDVSEENTTPLDLPWRNSTMWAPSFVVAVLQMYLILSQMDSKSLFVAKVD